MPRIRPATPADVPVILRLVRDLAEYERAPEKVVATEQDFLRHGFGPAARYSVLLAEEDGQVAGFSLWFFTFSTWLGKPGLYLEDLFVRPELRGRGIGKAMMIELARIAVREGCGRFEWAVLDWNQPSIEFYRSLGARLMEEWVVCRLEGDSLRALAEREG
ncbi:MAG TPA: GNAT family N-acetyltransferase [Myxococcales bacterium]|nr:GNAT family N-acetyltransferase [Myxococcales bacterium]